MLINPYVFGRLWTPSNITTALWLDASDSSTVTTVSGAISQWSDKSGNSRNATNGTPLARPAYSSAFLNSYSVATFDGVNDFLATSSVTLHSGVYSCFAVAIGSNTTGTSVLASQDKNTSPSTRNGQYIRTNSAAAESIAFNTSGGAYTSSFSGLSPLSWRIYSIVRPSTSVTIYVDAQAGSTTTLSGTSATAANPLILGARETDGGVFTNFWNGSLAEYVFLSTSMDTPTRQLVEGYLAWKWGLAANLPASHPYKSAPPTVQ